jgi:hypothetical protein
MRKKKKDKDENNDGVPKFDFIKTYKNNILKIIRNKETIELINNLVVNTNKIVIRIYNFIKLYFIYLYDNNLEFPIIDKNFIGDVIKVIIDRKDKRGSTSKNKYTPQLVNIDKFNTDHFSKLIEDKEILYSDKMSFVLAYEQIDIVKNINNNIEMNFLTQLNKYVNWSFDTYSKRKEIGKIKDREIRMEKYKALSTEFKNIKDDLITLEEFKSDIKYHEWINIQRQFILPNKNKFDKNSIVYDLCSNTQDYLKGYIYIGKELEKLNDILEDDEKEVKLFNILPLRSNIIPKAITIDTAGLIQNLLDDESTSEHYKNYKQDNNQYELWNRFFKLDNKMFKNKQNYKFHYMIKTDGVSVGVNFIRLKDDGTPYKFNPIVNKMKAEETTKYIEKITITDELRNKKLVCADPNISNDLIYCGSKDKDGNLETFRYTQSQRNSETKHIKYRRITDKFSKYYRVGNKTVKELETTLSHYNKRTNDFEKFKDYLIQKNKLNNLLFEYYENYIFRKFKFNKYINTQKSESKMIKNFTKKYGKPEDVVFVIGDFDKGNNHMKGNEPVITKKFRRIFTNAGFENYLVNEFRTSKLCNCCNKELEPFKYKPHPKTGKDKLCYGLLSHTDLKHKCQIIHNRDTNAVRNMLNIVESIYKTGLRPLNFTRTKKED